MNGEDITQFNIRSFYDHSRRRRTTLAKYIFLLQINKDRERSEHLSRTLPSYVFQKVHFGSKYSGVLRSPQKLKMFWGPHSRAL